MQPSYASTIKKYDLYRKEAREITKNALPEYLEKLMLNGIDLKAITAFKTWKDAPERKVDWDWTFASRYCAKYPKAFDLSVWSGNTLLSLTLGRPTYRGASIRMDFIERTSRLTIYSGELFGVSQLAYETYGRLIGAESIRLVEPMNQKLITYYTSKDGGFKSFPAKQGNPHYLEKKL